MNGKYIFLFLILLTGGCIQIQPRQNGSPSAGPASASVPPAVSQIPESFRPWCSQLFDQLNEGKIRWEDISRYPAPEQLWREERFRLLRPRGKISSTDFSLVKITAAPEEPVRMLFNFLPLRIPYNRRLVWETRVSFEFNRAGEISDIRMFSETVPMQLDNALRLSPSDCNEISSVVLKALFRLHLPEKVRAAERFRFCFPLNGADEKFRNHLRPRARIPELNPEEEYPDFPIPFEKGRYRAFTHGAFYYYAGIVLPVSEKEVWVFDTAVRYAGGEISGTCYKLKKGLIFWEIVTEGTCDAPSRAVKEKENL